MKEVIDEVSGWIEDGQDEIVLATVLKTWGSAPRRPGAKMTVNAAQQIAGSVSGGCVESAVIEAALETLESKDPQVLHFSVADETAWDVGLACGGSIDVFVDKLDQNYFELARRLITSERAGALVTVVRGPEGTIGQKLLLEGEDEIASDMDPVLTERVKSAVREVKDTQLLALDTEMEIFVEQIRPSPTMIAVGGVDIAIALTRIAQMLDYRTVVVDPRRVFGSDDRFPHVDALIQKWPKAAFAEIGLTPDMAVALLTHDPKIDDPALKILLSSDVFYIGALGSRKTHARRLKRLSKMGFTDRQTDRIFAPIGMEIGAGNPQEIAVAIMAQIVAERHNRATELETE